MQNDFARWRDDFPLLQAPVRGQPLIYLDNSATNQKPLCVINALNNYYTMQNANIHRGVYHLSQQASTAFENVRVQVQEFIHAKQAQEIIFVRGTTEGINLIAQSYGGSQLTPDDEIMLSTMEHHSNIVPWQLIAAKTGAKLRVIPITDEGAIDLAAYAKLFSARTKILAITHVSNVLGTVNPIKEMIAIAHAHHVKVVVDGAQALPHLAVDVQDLDCDFYVFSSHKAYGPMGIGVVYGKAELLAAMPPFQGGGDMIETVSFERTTYQPAPYKFEAGTPDVGGVIAFGAALNYLSQVGLPAIAAHEQELLGYATQQLSTLKGLRIIGTAPGKIGVISFVLAGIHPHDLATILDEEGIAIRAGHHCAMPLMKRFALPATTRMSLGLYNTPADVDALVKGLHSAQRIFHVSTA